MKHPINAADVHRRLLLLYPEARATGHFDEALELIDDHVIDHRGGADGDHYGIEAWRGKWQAIAADDSFRDVSVTVEQNVGAGDISANRYTVAGTHAATGRRYQVTGLDMIRTANGRVVEHWALVDTDGMRHQLQLES